MHKSQSQQYPLEQSNNRGDYLQVKKSQGFCKSETMYFNKKMKYPSQRGSMA